MYKIVSTNEEELSKRTVEDLDSQKCQEIKRKIAIKTQEENGLCRGDK